MRRNLIVGLVLIGVGLFLILQKALHLTIDLWQFVWPFFLLVPGISKHVEFFKNRRDAGSLVIAGILTVYGLLFLIHAITSWKYSHMLTFVYPLGIGIGFWESYVLGDRRSSVLSIAIVFMVISLYMLLNVALPNLAVNYKYYIVPALLVVIGMVVIFKGVNGDNKN